MCKKRIGTWARRKKGKKDLVDHKLWAQIQKEFPGSIKNFNVPWNSAIKMVSIHLERVELRTAGEDEDPDDLDELFPCVPTHQFGDTGSIG